MGRYHAVPVPMFGRMSAAFRQPTLPLPPKPCVKKIGILCSSWKVEVTDEECAKCHTGDSRAKLVVIERSIKNGVVRRREPLKCKHVKSVLKKEVKPCCGGTKTMVVANIICGIDSKEYMTAMCFSCTSYDEGETGANS